VLHTVNAEIDILFFATSGQPGWEVSLGIKVSVNPTRSVGPSSAALGVNRGVLAAPSD
jgi:hypothetical protein